MDLLALGLYRAMSGTRSPSPDRPDDDSDVPDIALEACRELATAVSLTIRYLTDDAPR